MKVGDYVRTKDGIKKVLKYTYNEKYENGHCVWFDNKDYGILFTDEEVNKMKPSPNIMNLIEVGDYVNGCPVLYKENNELVCGLLLKYKEENIENIVTHEQFKSMQYHLESEVN